MSEYKEVLKKWVAEKFKLDIDTIDSVVLEWNGGSSYVPSEDDSCWEGAHVEGRIYFKGNKYPYPFDEESLGDIGDLLTDLFIIAEQE